jgi:hypothetical protein
MHLGAERRTRVRQRVEPILRAYDPELQFITVFVDSTRDHLGVVVQMEDRPLLLKFAWVDFISSSDSLLRERIYAQLDQKLHRTTELPHNQPIPA